MPNPAGLRLPFGFLLPRRQVHDPLPGGPQNGIIAFTYIPSDDGRFALVELVARDHATLEPILADRRVKSFEKGKAKRGDIETEFRRFKNAIDLDRFGVAVP